jgi:glycosyltransferase involved in cell wall biosynthesis
MKVLMINYEYPPLGGGGGFVARDIVEEMSLKGHEITVITSCAQGLAAHENVNGVNIFRVPVLFRKETQVASMLSMLLYPPSSVMATLRRFTRNSFEIINTHFAVPSGPAGFVLSRVFKIPNVLTIHGGDIFDPSKSSSPHKTPLVSSVVRMMLNTADRVVAQSTDTKNNARKYYRVERSIDIIPLGIKKPKFEKRSRVDFGLNNNELVFCTIGRLVRRKNIDDTLQVLSRLDDYRYKFLVIGDGPERLHLEDLTKTLRLENRVKFMGSVSEEVKYQLLDLSDVYLSTAMHEGFGLVFLEAMECGLPIVCYDRGGQTDFLASGQTGYLVSLGDMDAFLERLLSIINDSESRNEISRNNRQLIKSFYIERCAERYSSLFEEVIRTRPFRGLR